MPTPSISVVIPTYQRRGIVVDLVRALGEQEYDRPFEVVIVVDGSTDGTTEALAELQTEFPLRVISQPNRGLSRARNRGAAEAAGDILLFLDDDMVPDSRLLVEHAASHAAGAEFVSGAVPLHPDSPVNLLSDGVRIWADDLARRCARPGHVQRYDEIVNGQFSIRRSVFEALGGFDGRFTEAGSYGNEDTDFGYRLLRAGHVIAYNPRAVTYQYYSVQAATYLRQYRQVGQADVALVRKYPELSGSVFDGTLAGSRLHRAVRAPTRSFPRVMSRVADALRPVVVGRVDRGLRDPITARLFFAVRAIEYWVGVEDAGGVP